MVARIYNKLTAGNVPKGKTASPLATTKSKNATLEFPKKSTFHILKSRRPPCVLTHKQITFFNEVESYSYNKYQVTQSILNL